MTLRLLFATNYLHFPQGGGGAERNTHELCLALREHGVEPAVMSGLQPDGSRVFRINQLKRGILTRQLYPRDTGCGYPVFRGWAEGGAAEVVGRFRPDAVVVQSTHPEALLRAFTALGLPLAAYQHEVEELGHLRQHAGAVPFLANSGFTARRLLEQCGIEAEVILPLIDRRHYAVETRPERVLFVNTTARKGLAIALGLARARPDIAFDFTTSWTLKPPQREALEREAREAGNVTLHAPTRDMRPLYARARVLLAPSQWEEAWGRVATEAHVNGIPVVGSDRGGLPDAIGPGGAIVPAEAPLDAWLAALAGVWDDAGRYEALSRAARAYGERPEIQPATIACKLRDFMAARIERGA